MSGTAAFFTRVLADMFPGRPADRDRHASAAQASQENASPKPVTASDEGRVIGQGEANETHITIAGVPHLFVDEGDQVAQFKPAFDEQIRQTAFGVKVLPELTPHWAHVASHRCSLRDAIAKAIRGAVKGTVSAPEAGGQTSPSPAGVERPGIDTGGSEIEDEETDRPRRAAVAQHDASDFAAITGTVTGWGEEKFPRRKGSGKGFYTSFAMRLDTEMGERTLQGEGLKDAISDSRCEVGHVVSVKRLRKIKVPAFHSSGQPRLVDGKQVMWDKWLWSITRL